MFRNSDFGIRIFTLVASLLFVASPLAAADPTIEVRDVLWGFDGTVMRDRFAPLTLVVDNPTNEAFDGELRLYRADFGGGRVGGFHVETIYLAPATQRIVQFYPYTIDDQESWILAWEGGQMALPKPRFSGPARVLLADDGSLFERGGAVKRFPARSFPPLVTATDCLAEVVLDHAPDWDAPRRQALLGWLKQGGRLHLINGLDGRQPQFTGDLAVLNEPSDEFAVGHGLIRRHAIGRPELNGDYVRAQLDPPPRPVVEETPEELERQRVNQYGVGYRYPLEQWQMSAGVFNQLKRMVKVEHNWAVIHLLSLSYVAVLFPGCFLIGREFRNVPATFGAIVGSTLLFGGAFYLVGNRGYGESTNVHSVALAEHVEGDRYDVAQWSSVFAIAGGDYKFIHSGQGRIYTDATENEPVGGTTTSGSAGRFEVDVPPYSTRIMAHKTLVQVPKVTAPKPAGGETNPVFRIPPDFPKQTRAIYVLMDRKAYPCHRVGDEIRVTGVEEKLYEFLEITDGDFVAGVGFWGQEEDENVDQRLSQLVKPLILYSLRLTTDDELKEYYVPEGRAKLFVYAPLSPAFEALAAEAVTEGQAPPAEPIPSQTGGVMYSFDLAL
ncbi:MAG: hypothetical protein WBC44_10735 [Planctomycetaceae bacterium]